MPLIQENTEELFKESKKNSLQFLKLFLQMQISCLQTMAYSQPNISDQEYAEKQLIESLILMDHLLMHLYSRDFLFYYDVSHDLYSNLKNEIEDIEILILEFKQHLDKHSFSNQSYIDQCERLIDQISNFFYSDYVKVIIVDDQLAEPWISFSND